VLAILFVIFSIVVIAARRRVHEAKLRPASTRIMLAVLPFENLTGDPQQEYLSDGVTDELIMHLSRFSPGYLGLPAGNPHPTRG
jgi:hypothetical protein